MERDRRTSHRLRRESFKKEEARRATREPISGAQPEQKKVHKMPEMKAGSKRKRKESGHDYAGEQTHTHTTKRVELPTVQDRQHEEHNSSHSLAESAVLAAALIRSRDQWIQQGIFARFWTKPSKKKGQTEGNKNPAKETMSKIGSCKIEIAPHVFDAVLFTVKEESQNAKSNLGHATWKHNAQIQNDRPEGPQTDQTRQPQPQGIVKSEHQNGQSSTPTAIRSPGESHSNEHTSLHQPPKPHFSTAQSYESKHHNSTPVKPNVPSPNRTGSDPVIQMLAQRASTNAELKELMKIVASGQASASQLRVFQSHIDDLSNIVKNSEQNSSGFSGSKTAALGSGTEARTFNNAASIRTKTLLSPSNASLKGTIPSRTKSSNINAVAFQFSMGSSDRFLVPKQCIAERLSGEGHQARLTFAINPSSLERHGHDSNYRENDYHIVSILLRTDSAKVLETVLSTLSPTEDVRKHMLQTMIDGRQCDQTELKLRLPAQGDARSSTADASSETPSQLLLKKEKQRLTGGRVGQANLHCSFCYGPVTQEASHREQSCSRCLQLLKGTFSDIGSRAIKRKPGRTYEGGAQHLLWTSLVHS